MCGETLLLLLLLLMPAAALKCAEMLDLLLDRTSAALNHSEIDDLYSA